MVSHKSDSKETYDPPTNKMTRLHCLVVQLHTPTISLLFPLQLLLLLPQDNHALLSSADS